MFCGIRHIRHQHHRLQGFDKQSAHLADCFVLFALIRSRSPLLAHLVLPPEGESGKERLLKISGITSKNG